MNMSHSDKAELIQALTAFISEKYPFNSDDENYNDQRSACIFGALQKANIEGVYHLKREIVSHPKYGLKPEIYALAIGQHIIGLDGEQSWDEIEKTETGEDNVESVEQYSPTNALGINHMTGVYPFMKKHLLKVVDAGCVFINHWIEAYKLEQNTGSSPQKKRGQRL